LEQSRETLGTNGVRIAAVSYDSVPTLKNFAAQHGIGFPLLSDGDSAVIRSLGIFNMNIAPGLRAHGVPHPVDYLVAPDGVVIRKYFVPNYMHRVTASSVVLREFGAASGPAVALRSGPLTVEVALSGARAFAGQEIGFAAKFTLQQGWHVYGTPLPDPYTAVSIVFDDPNVTHQLLELPDARFVEFPALDETLPVYSDSFEAKGSLLLRFPLAAGNIRLRGELRFQMCSETVCEAPAAIAFELPLVIEPFLVAAPKK
jgi:AhpC/TSA family protein/cytochrome c biogenesis DsbD-like protein